MSLAELIRDLILKWNHNARIDERLLKMQENIANNIYEEANSGKLFLLRMPSGKGKTEIFVSPFLYQFKKDEFFAGRMFIIEPVHALLIQMRERIKKYVQGLDIPVGEDHGEVESPTYLYTAPITLTTIDSFAYGFLAKRIMKWTEYNYETGRYILPVGIIANSYIVFDEAHLIQDSVFLSPRVMGKIICNLVNSGSIVVFSSATLPNKILDRLTSECKNKVVELGENTIREVKYEFREGKELSSNEIECKGNTIIIVNTISKARKIYYELKEKCKGYNVKILHSLVTKKDKEKVYNEIKNNLDNTILIGTQTLEVGLDFDFRVLYTELSPLDSLLQRLGRIGRKSSDSIAYIYDVSNSAPYLNILVEKTRNTINKGDINLDNVYDDETIHKIETNGDALYVQFLEYVDNLHLLSYPPEEDVSVRPSTYITIYLVDNTKEDEIIKVKKEDIDSVKYSISLIDNYSVKRLRDLINAHGNYYYIYTNEDKEGIYLKKKENLNISFIMNNFSIFLIKNKVYDDAGLKIIDSERNRDGRK